MNIDFDDDWKLLRPPSESPPFEPEPSLYVVRLVCEQNGREVVDREYPIPQSYFSGAHLKDFVVLMTATAEMTNQRIEMLSPQRKVVWTNDLKRHLLVGDTLTITLNILGVGLLK